MLARFRFFVLAAAFFALPAYAHATAWDISTATYQNKEYSVISQSGGSQDVALSADGTKMYVFDSTSPHIRQYTLSTAWDITTATYDNVSASTSGQNNGYPRGGAFKSDGTKLYIVNSEGSTGVDTVFQYSLSTAWDISTISYDSVSFYVGTQNTYPVNITFKTDGTAMYLTAYGGSVYQYTLSTAWDLSSASYANKSFYPSAQTTTLDDVEFSADGTIMYLKGLSDGKIYQYTLSSAWDVSTASYASKQLNYNAVLSASSVQGLHFRENGERLYLISISTDKVYQYALHTDTTVPTVALSAPSDNASVSGTATISATASDDTAVSGVKFYVNNVLSGSEDTSSPYSISWNTFTAGNGTSTILAVARDSAGNVATSTAISVLVSNAAPSTAATSASIGSISGKTATISWTSGNGSSRVVFMKAGVSSGEAAPVDAATYTASAAFGSGTQIGSTGWYTVYNGTGSSVSVSNLDYSQSYRVHVVEYNGSAGYQLYQTAAGSGNPANKSAYAGTTIYSNYSTGNDSTGSGSSGAPYKTFHKAYTSAADGDTINLTGTFSWNNADETGDTTAGYTLSKQLTIVGQKAGDTIVQAHTAANTATSRVFTVSSGYTVAMRNFTMRYGNINNGAACVFNNGGILTLQYVDIYSCRGTVGSGGAVYNGNTSTTTVEYSSIRNSTVTTGSGAGVYTGGSTSELYITDSTITGNNTATSSSTYLGGGVYVQSGKAWFTNVTITGNTSYQGGFAIEGGTAYVRNTLIAGNTAVSSTNVDIYRSAGTITSNGYNIVGEYTLSHFATSTADWSDQNGDGTYLLSGGGSGTLSLASATVDATYGTYAHALQSGSIGIDHGTTTAHSAGGSTVSIPSSDQWVQSRSGATDIGAYEWRSSDSSAPSVSLTLPDDGATIYGSAIGISASASDDTAVAGVKFYVNNILVGSEDTSSPYSIIWNSLSATTSGTKIIRAVARDSSDNYATSTARTVTLSNQPSPSSLSYSAATNTATVQWATPVEGSSRMYFGFTSALASSTPEQNTSTRVTSHSVNLSGLPRCAVFRYQTVSKNESSEVATSTQSTFKTAGCSGSASILANNEDDITAASGGTLTQGVLSLTVPASFTATSSQATFQAKKLDGSTFFSNITGPSGKTRAGTTVYNLSAYTDTSTTLDTFASPLTVTLEYETADVSGLDTSTLKIQRYDGSAWSELSGCSVNTTARTVSCSTTQFSDFAIFGDASSGSSGSSSNTSGAYGRSVPISPPVQTVYTSDGRVGVYENGAYAFASSTASMSSETGTVALRFPRNLYRGISGEDVRALQQFLNARGCLVADEGDGSPGHESDYFGVRTVRALACFQRASGITPSLGYFGPKTRSFVETVPATEEQSVPSAGAAEEEAASAATPPVVPVRAFEPVAFSRDLGRGTYHEDVRLLQAFLNKLGYRIADAGDGSPGKETTFFGESTRLALARFQADHRLAPSNGYLGPYTRAFIRGDR